MKQKKIQITTEDEVTLNATIYMTKNPKGVVLINPGTATKTSFYLPFAEFFVHNGFHVVLWNYRGFCESRTSNLKHSQYKYSDIGRFDIPAMIEKVKNLFCELPLYCIGHSAGGQQLGLSKNYHQLDAFIAVAVSAGYFAYMPLSYRIKANFFFRFFAPITGKIFKYVPAKKLKLMEDLPTGFANEWGQWCRQKQLFFSKKFYGKTVPAGAYKDFNIPTFVFTADDDEICTIKNTDNFWQNVTSKRPISFKRYSASNLPHKSIGHFGYFKKHNNQIWQDILGCLNQLNQAN